MNASHMGKNQDESVIAAIRKDFYALRNGMIADTLRKGGLGQKYIFGLQLPQIKYLADKYRPLENDEAAAMARMLWSDKECREARLLACHLMPPTAISEDEATEWAEGITSREEGDILAFRLLRHLPSASRIAEKAQSPSSPLGQHMAEAIRRFITT